MAGRLYIGIDLGTFQSTIAASNGVQQTVETVVGRPKDPVARNFLGRDILFGQDAQKNKLACRIYRPMQTGVARDGKENRAAAKSFVAHLIEWANPEEYDEVYGVICSPSSISFTDKSNLVSTLRGQVNAIMVISEPFAVAFGLDEIGGSIVVDIGAGTMDMARIHGTFPSDDDELSIASAGDWIDEQLMTLISKKFTGAQITKDMVRGWKELFSYVTADQRECLVELSVEGKKQVVDIGDLIRTSCEGVIPHMVNGLKQIVSGADPEYQAVLRNNIILAGGGSLIDGLADRVAEDLSDIGDVTVWAVDDPFARVADGALKLSLVMPDEQYTAID